jgi:glycosyltransferase involved in cell wall biosynthesis
VGGNPEVVRHGENGLLVPLDDGAAIGRSIDSLLDDPALAARLTAQGARDVLDFRWDELVRQTANTLEELTLPKGTPLGAPLERDAPASLRYPDLRP